jgi:nucleoside-diphosphate-sugar epimerase
MNTNEHRSSQGLHVVLGGGQIGDRLARLLAARGGRVRIVQRTAKDESRPNITRMTGDMRDLKFAEQATAGASVVYDCMNPQYHQWQTHLLALGGGALHGARKAGARLVALDCLYMYGAPEGKMREDSPRNPCSKKGVLRVELERLRMSAAERGELEVAIGRAGSFFGIDVPQSAFGPRFFERLLAGKSIECMGDPDLPHSYSYVEDVALGLATLGSDARAANKVWHLPTPPAESTRQLAERLASGLGRKVRVKPVPRWLLQTVGVFSPLMRELPEMMYQWEVPYVLDDSQYRSVFGQSATPIDEAVEAIVAWARTRFVKQRTASGSRATA